MAKAVTLTDHGKWVELEGIGQADAEDIFGDVEEQYGTIRVHAPLAKVKQLLRDKGGYTSKIKKNAVMALRVAARFQRMAESPRQHAKELTHPINKPKGIETAIVREHGRSVNHRQDTVKPEHRDIQPEDVFAGTPDQMGVRNLAETGKDLKKVLENQVPKDKGHDSVSNLSQYLIRTEGGGGAKPAG